MLYVVGTPIGHMADITLRGLEVLKSVDGIICEDTRETLKLLRHYGVVKPLYSFFREKEKRKLPFLMNLLKEGKNLALVCDRGTPGISDPAYLLVREALNTGIQVSPVPGPSSLTAALSVSGLPADKISFFGFLPRKAARKKKILKSLKDQEETLVFFESVHRIGETLQLIAEIFGTREITICRELTKKFEEIRTGQAGESPGWFPQSRQKGEFVIIIRGAEKNKTGKAKKGDISW